MCRFLKPIRPIGMLGIFLLLPALLGAQTEVYSWLFKNGDGEWIGMAASESKGREGKPFVGWMPLPKNDSAGKGMLFSSSHTGAGEFLFIFKGFGGLRPNSLYRISTVSSFTLAGTENIEPGNLHLKVGGTPIRPKVNSGRPNFSKGKGAESGRDLFCVGTIHVQKDDTSRRFFAQNYDAPAIVATNHTGTLFIVLGIETKPDAYTPDIYLNTLRIWFDYVGVDSALLATDYRIYFNETDKPNAYTFEVVPEEDVLSYNIYTKDGHLVLVEEETDCLPSCPNLIDAAILPPDDYLVEFVLPNDRRVVKLLHIHE
ncbi:MAG: hypothetical protein NC396_07215 [Bacteroides sp.]|nr:hypothetical protein [Bacteroides sp.]MCM1086256.1 hypothetical protein [Bacteroides sp.]